jgi:hypothetical protein
MVFIALLFFISQWSLWNIFLLLYIVEMAFGFSSVDGLHWTVGLLNHWCSDIQISPILAFALGFHQAQVIKDCYRMSVIVHQSSNHQWSSPAIRLHQPFDLTFNQTPSPNLWSNPLMLTLLFFAGCVVQFFFFYVFTICINSMLFEITFAGN